MLSACSEKEPEIEDLAVEIPLPELIPSSDCESYFVGGMNFNSGEGSNSLSFSTNMDWTITVVNTRWCTVSQTSGQAGDISVQVHVDANEGYDDRNVVITIQAGELSKTVTVTQKQKDALTLTTNRFEVGRDGGIINVGVKANIFYEVVVPDEYKNWIIPKTSGRGLVTSVCSLQIANYNGYGQREGKVFLSTEQQHLNDTIYIIQTGRTYKIEVQNSTAIIEVAESELLPDIISKEIVNSTFQYKINGPINGTDIGFINNELYCKHLDLSDASIVSGGSFEVYDGVFVNKYELKEDNILPTYSFKNNRMESIILPKTLYEIEFAAFDNCASLTNVVFNDGLVVLSGFNNCISLKHVEIPNTVEKIGAAFSGTSLDNIIIPKSVISIGENAFNECMSLTSIVIPNSVTYLGAFAFRYCYNLSSVVLSDKLQEIGPRTFDGCPLKSIVLPSKIERIGEYAFGGNLKSVVLSASLKYIDNNAFGYVPEIHVESKIPVNCASNAFYFNEECTLYVPKGTKHLYQADPFWKKCKNIIE